MTEASSLPKRYIFTMEDMEHFKASPAKRDLLSFVTSLGRSTIASSYAFDPLNPLLGLSPGMACLHGSLSAVASDWLKELPPDKDARARFGNPVFKKWHQRLVDRSWGIIEAMMDCHVKYLVNSSKSSQRMGEWDMEVLKDCSEIGSKAASQDAFVRNNSTADDQSQHGTPSPSSQQNKVIVELQSYLLHAFGHPIRLDYGTGHECSFFVFLYSLCKIGMFGNIPKTTAPSANLMAPVALCITTQYLQVCRGIQDDYMLEPAGSHGVWGLDDYHCIPFYLGACQMQNKVYDEENYLPSSIHIDQLLKSTEGPASAMMYFQCIRYIKSLKKGVPFFESSPMLDDISRLPNWSKVSSGLLRLFEGEVLGKKPVVQHFVFGDIFRASWEPVGGEREAPMSAFGDRNGGSSIGGGGGMPPIGVDAVAPWASKPSGGTGSIPTTKAPWAK